MLIRRRALVALALAAPAIAAACGACVYSYAEPLVPAIAPWSFVAFFWYVAVGLLGYPLEATPGILWRFCITGTVAALAVAVSALFGPLPFIVLFGLACRGTYKLVAQEPEKTKWPRRAAIVLAVAVVVALVITHIRYAPLAPKDDVAYILKWSDTGGSRARIEKLKKKKDYRSLRQLLQSGNEFPASQAARILGEIGEPSIDAPNMVRILADLERQQTANPYVSWTIEEFQAALKELLGKEPVTGKKAKDWEALLPAPSGGS